MRENNALLIQSEIIELFKKATLLNARIIKINVKKDVCHLN